MASQNRLRTYGTPCSYININDNSSCLRGLHDGDLARSESRAELGGGGAAAGSAAQDHELKTNVLNGYNRVNFKSSVPITYLFLASLCGVVPNPLLPAAATMVGLILCMMTVSYT
jgi:hypothetical protein